ncbi:MAG: hypothetical protein NVSMB12_07430 [Acidimicrobiales bacterium]
MPDGRLEQFQADIAAMRIKDPSVGRDALLLRLGVVLMVGGLALTVIAYGASHSTKLDLDQRDDIIVALIGVATTIVGAALFLRYSLGAFLRFWLARLIFEQQRSAEVPDGTEQA